MSEELTETPATETMEPAAEPTPQVEATPAEKRMFKLKIDQKEEEFDEDTVIRMAQKGRAADKRFEEASSMRKEVKQILDTLDNPKQALQQLIKRNPGYRQAMEDMLAEQLEEETLSPEQREAKQLKAEYEQLKKEKEERLKTDEQKELEQLTEKAVERLQTKIMTVLDTAGLPKTPYTVKRIAEQMQHIAERDGIAASDVELTDIIERVRGGYDTEIKTFADSLDAAGLIKWLGKDNVAKVRKHFIDASSKSNGATAEPPKTAAKPAATGERKFIGIREARSLLP